MAKSHPHRISIPGACPHDCPDRCAWVVTVEEGRAVGLVGDSNHPFTHGALCAKVNHYLDRVYSPDRVLYPLRRSGAKGDGAFEQVSWDEALNDIANRLQQIIAAHGPTAILPYSFSGTQGQIQSNAMGGRFFHRLGATRLDRAVCGNAGGAGVQATMGSTIGMLPEDLALSRFILLWGTNTIVTNLHLWPFIRQAQENGAQVVVIDPLRTRTASAADWHVRPLPGTDAALALGMMSVIVAEKLYDAGYVAAHTVGFDALEERLAVYSPERVAAITRLEVEEIISLARAYATTRPAAIRVLIGMEHHASAEMSFRAITCLPALIGAWRERGGGLLHHTMALHAQALNGPGVRMPELEDMSIRSVNMVQLGKALTDPALDPPIQALFVYNSNPATTTPNQKLVLQGLRRDDLFTVVHDHFLTDTARYADYVLPSTMEVEHSDLFTSWGHTYVTLNQPAIAPRGEAIPPTELFRRLAARMGLDEPYLQESDESMIRTALTSDHPYLHGIDFDLLRSQGWAPLNLPEDWLPYTEGGFPTPSGKCEFYSDSLAERGLDPLPTYLPAGESPEGNPELAARYPLLLLTPKSALHFLNSSYANSPRHLRAERTPFLDIHPQDAASRGIVEGDLVQVHNDRGSVEIVVRVTDRMRPGVVAMPSGWWASLSPGGVSANALTADGLSLWAGGGDFHDTLVEVEPARAGAPANEQAIEPA
jgi:anaerobic selenocysteine-containing dehydrogenase